MHKSRRVKITDLNPHLSCVLCKGYLIDATTIIECLHSFCRSCIVKYLEFNKYCPICDVQVHKTKPLLNIRSDQTLQDIVYKLVPGLFQNEMCRRRDFYGKHPDHKPSNAEESGQVTQFSHIYTADESISLSLEYYNNNESVDSDNNSSETKLKAHPSRRYLRCPAAVSVAHLQKLIRAKFGLSSEHRVDILYMNDKLNEDLTLMDIAYIYLWRRKGPLHFTYRIFEVAKRIKLNEPIKDEPQVKGDTESSVAETTCPNSKWKEVQLQISENGVMSVTNIEEAKPELVTSNVVELKLLKGTVVEAGSEVKPEENAPKEQKLGKHKLQESNEDKPIHGKVMRPSFPRTPILLKNVQQLSRNHPLKIHSQLVAKSNANNSLNVSVNVKEQSTNVTTTRPSCVPCPPPATPPSDHALNNNKLALTPVQKEPATTVPNTVQSTPPVQSAPKTSCSPSPLADKSTRPAPNCVTSSAPPTPTPPPPTPPPPPPPPSQPPSQPPQPSLPAPPPSHSSDHSSFGASPMPNIPKYTQAGQSHDTTTTTSSKGAHPTANNCIQSSKVSIVPKKTTVKLNAPIGYKTLRDPPKAWNPQISRQNLIKTNVFNSNNGASTSDINKLDTRPPPKPNKFFKRNNMPRYLGNPASGVKPMYQVRDGDKSPPDTKKVPELKKTAFETKMHNNNNNKEENKAKADTTTDQKNRQQSIIKIDPKTLKPITDKPSAQELPSCSDIPEMKINQSTVPIFNPLRTQKSQTSPKIDRRSPKTSSTYQDIQNSPKSPKDRNSPKMNSSKTLNSPTSKKDKHSVNFTPPNPFIPNLTSPNVAPNQFLYPNFHSYDPRIISSLPAYHSLPFSMFYSQPRLNYPGLSSQNLPLSPNLMSSLNLEVNKSLRKNFDIPSMMQLSPPPDLKKPSTLVKNSRDNFVEDKNHSVGNEKSLENKNSSIRNIKSDKKLESKPSENNTKKEESPTPSKDETEQKKNNEQERPQEKAKPEVIVNEKKSENTEKIEPPVQNDKDKKEEKGSTQEETVKATTSDDKTCESTSKTEAVAPCSSTSNPEV